MKGVYQHCKEKHLHRYLAEFDFRYNYREALGYNDTDRTIAAVRGGEGKRLTYHDLAEPDFKFQAARFLRWRCKKKRGTNGPR